MVNTDMKMIETCASTNDDKPKSQEKMELQMDDEEEDDDQMISVEEMRDEIRKMWKVNFEEMLVRYIRDKREE